MTTLRWGRASKTRRASRRQPLRVSWERAWFCWRRKSVSPLERAVAMAWREARRAHLLMLFSFLILLSLSFGKVLKRERASISSFGVAFSVFDGYQLTRGNSYLRKSHVNFRFLNILLSNSFLANNFSGRSRQRGEPEVTAILEGFECGNRGSRGHSGEGRGGGMA